jgi:hypothetical protein
MTILRRSSLVEDCEEWDDPGVDEMVKVGSVRCSKGYPHGYASGGVGSVTLTA